MIKSFEGASPVLAPGAWVAENATVLGQVVLEADVSIWYGSVVRGDVGKISIGARTNIQDLSVVHITGGFMDTVIGSDVTVGHRAILHGCTVADHVLVGMGAILLDGVTVGEYSLIGAGAVLPPGMQVPPHSVVMGAPGKVVRALRDHERQIIDESAPHYVELARRHARS